MSYLFLGIAVASSFIALAHLILAVRVLAFGRGFDGFASFTYYTVVISGCIVLAVWLGPLALTGLGFL
jgi:hypothetical protein